MKSHGHPPAMLEVKAADCMRILHVSGDFISADIK
jgi:hypothetical protein